MANLSEIRPLGNRLLVEPTSKDEATASGIIIPDTAKEEKSQEGKVIAVGPGQVNEKGERVAMEVKTGDTVMFRKYSPDELEIDGKTYLIVAETDLLAIIN